MLAAVAVMALLAPVIAPHNPNTPSLANRLNPPFFISGHNPSHLLGTDFLGRDVLSRLLYGARVSLTVGAVTVVLATAIGIAVGVIAAYEGKWLDEILMRTVDIGLAIPFLLFAMAVVLLLGPSLTNVIIVLALNGWMGSARITRGITLSLKEREFIVAARAYGASHTRIIARHILINVLPATIIVASQQVGVFIYAESSLSFLGLGVPTGTPTWGGMIADGRSYLATAWWVSTLPGIVLTMTVMTAFFLGDGLRDVLDPRMRR